ncbi:hypothetical protein BC629DRAFT_1586371 [Irpex lacteus]|nr:hypothetical protein BC629DRAFT_1586371 [Irpex lacteus]
MFGSIYAVYTRFTRGPPPVWWACHRQDGEHEYDQHPCTIPSYRMGVNDLLHFDQYAYQRKISRPWYPDPDLYENIYKKRRQTVSSGFSIGAGVALAPVTAGGSLVSSAVGVRTLGIANQKLALLEAEWARRGYRRLPDHFLRDRVLPMAVTGAVSVATMGFDVGLGSAGANMVVQAGGHGVGQVIHGIGHGYATHNFIPQFATGTEKGFEEAAHYAVSGAAFPPHGYPVPPYRAMGEFVGVEGVKWGVHQGMERAAHTGQEYAARRWG